MATAAKGSPLPSAQTSTAAASATSALPGLSSILGRLTPSDYQSVADQLRSGASFVNVGGKSYQISNPAFRAQILQQYPGAPPTPATTTTAPPTPTYFGPGANALPPESAALAQMRQIDPTSEAARQWLASSIAAPGAGAAGMLGLYGQIDPTSLAMSRALGGQVGGNLALGSALDPTTQMQIEQASRAAQGARGNVYGVAPAVQEAMTTGQAGLALQQARQQAAQSYLQSGVGPGPTALQLLRNQQAATQSYLGSGVTPYQAGAGYLSNIQNQAQQAAGGGPLYQPTGISPNPYSYLNPTYGLSMGQEANQWYNSLLSQYGMGMAAAGPNRGMGALAGGLGGAASGALAGAPAGGIGAIPGAIIGGIGGAAKGYFG
jgi:hypothetical protein